MELESSTSSVSTVLVDHVHVFVSFRDTTIHYPVHHCNSYTMYTVLLSFVDHN